MWRFLQDLPHRRVLYTGLVYKLGCKAAMKVRDDDTLEGAVSLYGSLVRL